MLERTCKEYIDELASPAPVPGGGSVSGLTGALGTALAEMALNLSSGKKSLAGKEEQISSLLERFCSCRRMFAELSEQDAQGFKALSAVYGMRAETEAEKEEKAEKLEKALAVSAEAPYGILKLTGELAAVLPEVCACTTKTMKSDVYCAVSLCAATAECAYINVLANTRLMKDREYALRINDECCRTLTDVQTACRRLLKEIEEVLG